MTQSHMHKIFSENYTFLCWAFKLFQSYILYFSSYRWLVTHCGIHPAACSLLPPQQNHRENRKGKSENNVWVKIKTV